MRCFGLLFLVACSSARPAGDHVDASTTGDPDATAGNDAESGDAASTDAPPADAMIVDTCMPPTAAFVTDLPPTAGTNTTRRRAQLQVTDAGAIRAFTSDSYQNGSFYDANIVQHTRGATGWTQGSVANGGLGLSIGRYMATIGGADPCLAYSKDYDGTLHLKCASTTDRTLAPTVRGALAIVAHGANKHLVYENSAGALVHQLFDGDPQPTTTIHPSAWVFGPSSLAVDAAGNLHLAYVVIEPPPSGTSVGTRTVRYATRAAGAAAWTTEAVEGDTWSGSSEEADSVSLALVNGAPVIAYHLRASKSLRLAERTATGFAKRTLLAPDPAFDNDAVGKSVALASDCTGRLHVVYQRYLTTDAQPNLGLAYAQITATGLEHRAFLPMTASTAFRFNGPRHSLGFVVGADGKQYVAAQIGGIYGTALYVASR